MAMGPMEAHHDAAAPMEAHHDGAAPMEAEHTDGDHSHSMNETGVTQDASADMLCHWEYEKCTLSRPFVAAKAGLPEGWARCTEKNQVTTVHAMGWDCSTRHFALPVLRSLCSRMLCTACPAIWHRSKPVSVSVTTQGAHSAREAVTVTRTRPQGPPPR